MELPATGCDRCKAFKQELDEFMEEKSFGLLKTKNHHLLLKAGGLGGAQGMFLGQEHCKHLLWATARARAWVRCPVALTCCPEMEPEIRSCLGTPGTPLPPPGDACCTPRLGHLVGALSTPSFPSGLRLLCLSAEGRQVPHV